MSAKGKITVSEIGRRPRGTVRILLTDDPAGRRPATEGHAGPWYRAHNKRGMATATVTGMIAAAGNRRTQYYLTTDRGDVNALPGNTTFWLAPEAPAPATDAEPAQVDALPCGCAPGFQLCALYPGYHSPSSPAPVGPSSDDASAAPTFTLQASDNGGTTWRTVVTGLTAGAVTAHRARTTHGDGITWRVMPETDDEWELRTAAAEAALAGGRERLAKATTTRAADRLRATVAHLEQVLADARSRSTTPAAPDSTAPARITVNQLRDTTGVRVLLAEQYTDLAGGGSGQWRAARTPRPRGALYVKGEPAGVHAATVEKVVPNGLRYDVVTNLGTVEAVRGPQLFRIAPASMRDTAEVRTELAADRDQRKARVAEHMADLKRQVADRGAQAERDRAAARRFLAETAPEPASDEPTDRIRIERHRASVTQGEVSVRLDGELLGRYGDQVGICTSGSNGSDPHPHADGAVCFGGWHGLPDGHWYEVGNRAAVRRALVEPVYTAAARTGVDYHALADPGMTLTTCNRSTRTGQIRERAAVVAEHGSQPCTDCYPPAPLVEPVRSVPPWLVPHTTTTGRRVYVVHNGPRSESRPITGDGGTVRVEYLSNDGRQIGHFGWERPEDLTPQVEPFVSGWATIPTTEQ